MHRASSAMGVKEDTCCCNAAWYRAYLAPSIPGPQATVYRGPTPWPSGNPTMAPVAAPPLLRLPPRPYQHEAVATLLAAAARGVHRPLLVLPTGTGKTIIFALLVQRRGGRALILAHRDELIQQAVDKLHLLDP